MVVYRYFDVARVRDRALVLQVMRCSTILLASSDEHVVVLCVERYQTASIVVIENYQNSWVTAPNRMV
eukprot:m.1403516 g.1403516  ORF g.1403516 m.1403516 type:complete len:68 (+) comp25011_c0_seq51:855-1058(+)